MCKTPAFAIQLSILHQHQTLLILGLWWLSSFIGCGEGILWRVSSDAIYLFGGIKKDVIEKESGLNGG